MDIALVSVTAMSLSLALAMGIVAWRLIREERRRADARVAAMIAELDRTRGGPPASPPARPRSRDTPAPVVLDTRFGSDGTDDDALPQHPPPVPAPPAPLLGEVPGSSGWGYPILAVVAAGLMVLAVATIVMGPGDDARTATVISEPPTPVELLSLAHAKQGEYLAISGAVRNPADGMEHGRLSVMATVFDEDGTQIGTGQTPLPVRALAPGTETPFTISMPDADRINRYRISFAQDQTRVPHIDRRQMADATPLTTPASGDQP
jgi:hypothetical protein